MVYKSVHVVSAMQGGTAAVAAVLVPGSQRPLSCRISPLEGYTLYEVTVVAWNQRGYMWSQPLLFRTRMSRECFHQLFYEYDQQPCVLLYDYINIIGLKYRCINI